MLLLLVVVLFEVVEHVDQTGLLVGVLLLVLHLQLVFVELVLFLKDFILGGDVGFVLQLVLLLVVDIGHVATQLSFLLEEVHSEGVLRSINV